MVASCAVLMPDVFDSSQFDASERFERWRTRIAPALSMEAPDLNSSRYQARHESWNIGNFVFARETTAGGAFSRNRDQLRTATDHWCLLYLKAGSNISRARSGSGKFESSCHAQPGDLGFYSLTQHCQGMMSQSSALTLFIPRDEFAKQAHDLDKLNNSILSTPRARMLADYLLSLEKQVEKLTADDITAIAKATHVFVESCLLPSEESIKAAEEPASWLAQTKAGRYILAHLGDPALTPDHICREVGVSRSVLYRIFEPAGGVLQYIRRERLHAAHRLLTGDPTHRRVGEVAMAVGFTHASDFTRAYKREFGCAPIQSRCTLSHVTAEKPATGGEVVSLASWLGSST